MWFPCHVCGLVGHKMVECPQFAKMQKMFKDKNAKLVEISTTFLKKTPIALINMVVVAAIKYKNEKG
jgi:hypothetical protein